MDLRFAVHRSFAGGEIAPWLTRRADLQRHGTAVAKAFNWVVTPQGTAYNRRGSTLVESLGTVTLPARAVEFVPVDSQAYVLVFVTDEIWVYFDGARVLDGSSDPLVIAHTYDAADLFDLQFTQAGEVMTITHPDYAPATLTRTAANAFTLADIDFGPTMLIPIAATMGGSGSGSTTYTYGITRYNPDTGEESELYTAGGMSVTNDLTQAGNYVSITPNAPPVIDKGGVDNSRVRIYKMEAGLWGYIGEGKHNVAFIDDNIDADVGISPPEYQSLFDQAGRYPAVATYWNQRKIFASTTDLPQTHWMTRTGTESNMTYSIPSRATDSITYTLASQRAQQIRHLADLGDLYLFTQSAVWRSRSTDQGIISASTLEYRPVSFVGASKAPLAYTQRSVLFVGERANKVFELRTEQDEAAARDVSILAEHLTSLSGHTIIDTAFIANPHPIAFFLRSDGLVLGCSYEPDENVLGWFRIDMAGDTVASIVAVPEGDKDALYLVVRRSNGKMLERLLFGHETELRGAHPFLDCSVKQTSLGGATTITGLTHLANQAVSVLVDSNDNPITRTVSATGVMTLPSPANTVEVGLPYVCELQLLPFVITDMPAGGFGMVRNVHEVMIGLHRSKGVTVQVGPQAEELDLLSTSAWETETETWDEWDDVTYPSLFSGWTQTLTIDDSNTEGAITLWQRNPQPAHVTGVIALLSAD